MEFGSKFVYMQPEDEEEEEITMEGGEMSKLSLDTKSKDADGDVCMLDLLDTAGQEEYSAIREQYMRQSQAFVIVYAINNKNSFQEALDIHTLTLKIQESSTVPAILCGNKSDLESDRQVSTADAEKEAKARNMAFLETSAKTGTNVNEVFEELIKRTPRSGMEYKIAVLGSGGVGKSSIVMRFTHDMFMTNYDPTIEDSFRKMVTIKGIPNDMKKPQQTKNQPIPPAPPMPVKTSGIFQNLFGGGQKKKAPRPPQLQQRTTKEKAKKTDGNIILVSLGTLEQDPKMMTGDAVSCSKCSAILSHVSNVSPSSPGKSNKQWKCEFCDTENEVDIAEEAIPKESQVDFLEDAPAETADSKMTLETDKPDSRSGTVIYCIDVSSSMGTTTALPQLQAEWFALRQGGVTSISRLDCIKQAVQRQLDYHEIESPEKKAGLVSFGSVINFICDKTTNVNFQHTRDKIDGLLNLGRELAETENVQPLSDNAEAIKRQVKNLGLAGCTALGPALSLSVGFLSKIPGSEIVLCTDGLPNEGVGSLPGDTAFYTKIGEIAKDQQTTISVIGIQTGQEYEIETVSTAAAITGGTINLLNPHELSHKMREITLDVVVATNVKVTAILHPYLCFVSVKADVNKKSVATCTLGNVHKNTELTFRFKKKEEFKNVKVTSLPFQIQVHYTTKDGKRFLRVLTEMRETTSVRSDMESNLNIPVVGATAIKESKEQARAGNLRHAQRILVQNQAMSYNSVVNDVDMQEFRECEDGYADMYDMCNVYASSSEQQAAFRSTTETSKMRHGSAKKKMLLSRGKKDIAKHQDKYYNY